MRPILQFDLSFFGSPGKKRLTSLEIGPRLRVIIAAKMVPYNSPPLVKRGYDLRPRPRRDFGTALRGAPEADPR